jgi:hypothetical protein
VNEDMLQKRRACDRGQRQPLEKAIAVRREAGTTRFVCGTHRVNRCKKGIAFGRADCERHSSKWAESMSDLEELVASFHREFEESLGQESYLLADGRVGRISLYEHLVLTSGIAAAFAEELLRQGGKSA